MQDINVVTLSGRLTRDPELRKTGSGTSVCELGLAVNNRVKRGNDWQDAPCFIDVTVFGKAAEACCDSLKKGSGVFVSGELHMDSWQDKQSGQNRSKIKIGGDVQVKFADSKPASGGERRATKPADSQPGDDFDGF